MKQAKNTHFKLMLFTLLVLTLAIYIGYNHDISLNEHLTVAAEEVASTSNPDTSEYIHGYFSPVEDKAIPYQPEGDIYHNIEFIDNNISNATFYKYTQTVTNGSVIVYANGSTSGAKLRTKTLFTNMRPGVTFTQNSKTKIIRGTAGKLVVGVTMKQTLNAENYVKGRIKDTEAAKYAKATISNQVITVTAQKYEGKAYLWVIDTVTGYYISCPITIKMAPSTMTILKKSNSTSDFDRNNLKSLKITKGDVNVGKTLDIYLDATSKDQKNTPQVVTGCAYTCSSSASSYATVAQDPVDPFHFIISGVSLKNNKKTTAKITIQCIESSKKITFSANVVNQVESFSIKNPSSDIRFTTATSAAISASTGGAVTTTFELEAKGQCPSVTTITDTVRFSSAMTKADGYDKDKFATSGTLSVTSKVSNCKVSIVSNKGNAKITLSKGVTPGSYYFVIYYNNLPGGYDVLEIKVE